METLDPAIRGTGADVPALIPFPASLHLGTGAPLVVGERAVVRSGPGVGEAVRSLVLDLLAGVGVDAEETGAGDAVRVDLERRAVEGASPESYALTVAADGVRIAAPSDAGLFHGVQTLAQVLARRSTGADTVPALEIEDTPRFGYRGVMLDVARHFFDVETVKRFIDRIALAKINHLHLHLTDDQGWRLHIESWPLLTERGATGAVGGGRGGFYTADDYREIVAYAAARFITVVPEIDLPGHTHAALVAYPELAPRDYAGPAVMDPDAAAGERGVPVPYSGIAVGFSTVDVRNERVYAFVADVVRELAAMTPGPFLHLGGDESLSTTEEEYREFLDRVGAVAARTGKTLVFWHEAGVSDGLPTGSVGQYWDYVVPRGDAAVVTRRFVERGGRVVLSPADAVYLDMKHDDDDPYGLLWADGPTSLEAAYSWDPADVIAGLPDDAILGVEAPLWSETIDSLEGIDALLFPRVLAAAEIAWSPPASLCAERSWHSFARRVDAWGPRLDVLRVGSSSAGVRS